IPRRTGGPYQEEYRSAGSKRLSASMRLSSTASAKAVMSYGISRIRDSSSLRIKLRLGGRLRSGMTKRESKNAGCRPCKSSSGIAVDVQQRLNCALPSFSLSSGFFRFQSLHGISADDQLIHPRI